MSRSTTTSPTITPQMAVLGRDGRDLNVGYHESPFLLHRSPADAAAAAAATSSSSSSTANNSNNNKSSKWWGKWKLPSTLPSASILMAGDRGNVNDGIPEDDDNQHDDSASYTSMGEIMNDEESVGSKNSNSKPSLAILRSLALFHPTPSSSSDHPMSQQHNGRTTTTTRSNDNGLFTSVASDEFVKPPAKEEAVRNDCSFFYQGFEETPAAPMTTSSLQNQTYGLSVYNPLVPTPPRHRAAYRARFQQLNEEWRRHADIYGEDNELWLRDEDDEVDTIDSSTLSVSNVMHSSLCWAQDGRILMTLPKIRCASSWMKI
ncbi:hypothetical protein MHU86_22496 [Fragilaria crotonensis]|nr:hypothetical protein MHU86_22496 [Fragilaria crotonensis]